MFRCKPIAAAQAPELTAEQKAGRERKREEALSRYREALANQAPAPEVLAKLRALDKDLARAGLNEEARHLRRWRQGHDEALALALLGGRELEAKPTLELAKRLATYKQLGLARRVLEALRRRAIPRNHECYREIVQKSALYTYKDPDLPAAWALEHAFEILQQEEDLDSTQDPELFGLAGGICKRLWDLTGIRRHLELSLAYYLRGYALGAPEAERQDVLGYLQRTPDARLVANQDRGYCGVNAAFLLDLLAHEEEAEGLRLDVPAPTAAARRADARLIRREIVRSVPPLRELKDQGWLRDEWWFYATIGEAYFGLRKYCRALRWLVTEPAAAGLTVAFDRADPAGLDVPEWEYESTARQLARLARLQGRPRMTEQEFRRTHAAEALRIFLQGDEEAVGSSFRGKFGLALSGGGFRASFFHIGVLARLAEADLLRHVEVLSCVSGGSIVGAHYYLKLKRLLESRTDRPTAGAGTASRQPPEALRQADYVELVRELEDEFLAGVQKNIRTRVLGDPVANLKMIFWPGYSRTSRVGELYEKHLFQRVKGATTGALRLDELLVHPRLPTGELQKDFHPRNHNWRRRHKVPTLVLNATSLNTGHAWQFTASYMGEPPMPILAQIDANERLRRMYYRDAPEPHRHVRLGQAVAASSCVPGLFEPLILDGLYPGRSVRLVDGGVCDNQGVASLLEQDCSVILVSDGSGQMDAERVPSSGVLGVPLRSNSVLQARVREAQYGDVAARRRSGGLRGMLFVHLRAGLPGEAVAWNECPADRAVSDFEHDRAKRDRTAYDVDLELQRKLAAIRTDLDSFSDAEADALMTSGYRITDGELAGGTAVEGIAPPPDLREWRFLKRTQGLAPRTTATAHLRRILGVGSRSAFKVWSLSRPLAAARWVLLAAVAAAVVSAAWRWSAEPVVRGTLATWLGALTVGRLALALAGVLGFLTLSRLLRVLLGPRTSWFALRLLRFRETLRYVAVGVGMGLVGWIFAQVHLHLFDPIFLRCGSRDRIPPPPPGPPAAGESPGEPPHELVPPRAA